MTATENKPGWLAKNRNMLFLLACVVLGQVVFYFTTTANSKREIERYKALQLASRVEKVLSYSHGIQKVKLATGETQALVLTAAGQQYIQVGDSLVKAAGSDSITAYRRFPGYIEVSVFGPGAAGKMRLIKRSE
ncbi:hypothetical protein KB206_18600 [Microvirga sp. STS02]|uniref:hypothetical protein n=1 Tax=Hymenobacter negativus TaxID=2795026 RepID=UPI0018DE1975|nr:MULTISPECIES: hypothetical protein [Bacteria]MBH8570908.1 hypothetical protein [Hymenobacter negativus]MBR7210646.1 hypothetical protein [Microvirga sp. STS02]